MHRKAAENSNDCTVNYSISRLTRCVSRGKKGERALKGFRVGGSMRFHEEMAISSIFVPQYELLMKHNSFV